MSRGKRFIMLTVLVPIGLFVLAFLIFPAHSDATAQAKIAEVLLYLSAARQELSEGCRQGSLVAGMTHKSLGFPDPYKPGRFIKEVTVHVDRPQRLVITATLMDIYSEIFIWRRLAIPAGARIVEVGQCEGGQVVWRFDETSVPSNYLPQFYRPVGPNKTPAN